MKRYGFTLIELLVTMGLIIVLLSIVVGVSNSATLDSYKINGAADRVAQTLLTAKMRAARDKAPRGVRFLAGADGFIREAIYIEQPEGIIFSSVGESYGNTPSGYQIVRPNPSFLAILSPRDATQNPPNFGPPRSQDRLVYLILSTDLPPNYADNSSRGLSDHQKFMTSYSSLANCLVQSAELNASFTFNSYDDVTGTALATTYGNTGNHRIFLLGHRATATAPLTPVQPVLPDLCAGQTPRANNTSPPPAPLPATIHSANFTIVFGSSPSSATGQNQQIARPLAGEPTIILSKNAAIDLTASLPSVNPASSLDILFSPSGQVMFRGEGLIALLVRDTFRSNPPQPTTAELLAGWTWLTLPGTSVTNYRQAGEMVLVGIYPKNGTVVTKPVAEPDGTAEGPFKFVKDAINSGL